MLLRHCDFTHSVFLQELVLQHRDSQESILVEIPSHVYVGIFNVNLQEVRLAISKKHAVQCIIGAHTVFLMLHWNRTSHVLFDHTGHC